MSNDIVTDIIAYETGELDLSGTLELFKRLIETGAVNTLQGHYGRTAHALIDNGILIVNKDNTITIDKEKI